jgi:hypothetical protein
MKSATPDQTVVIRPFTQDEALLHLKANPALLSNVSAMAKAWRRSRSTVRQWQKAWEQRGELPTSIRKLDPVPVEPALPSPKVPAVAIDVAAYGVAIALAGIAAFLSVTGLAVMFPGASAAVAAMAATMEVAKLVTTAWLARRWRSTP